MWDRFKSWFRRADKPEPAVMSEPSFKWYEVGEENPFPFRVLDVRSFTWNVMAMTTDPNVAMKFNAQRLTDGQEFRDTVIANAASLDCDLAFPHNGEALEGIVFKADSMDVKWDIYIYESVFLFTRSWTGEFRFRAFAEISDNEIRIRRIECSVDELETARQSVYFLIGTHAMRRVLPHTLPGNTPNTPALMAQVSFSLFGKLACYATFDDITQIEIPRPSTE